MLTELFTDMASSAAEPFMNENGGASSTARLIGRVVGLVLSIVIVLLVGKFLWNNAAVKLISGLKPVKNILELLGLMLLLGLLFP